MRTRLLLLLALQAAVPTSSASAAAAPGAERYCRALRPICHVGQAPMCVCATRSITSCAWVCVGQP